MAERRLRMSQKLRTELEHIAVLCSEMDPHNACERLEAILGGKVDDDLQRVVYAALEGDDG